VLAQVVRAAVRIVMWPAVFQIKRLPRARNRTAQLLRPTVEPVACRRSAVLVAVAVAAALPKLEARVLATEVQARAEELAEKAAKELPSHCELILQLCTALVVAAKEDG